MFPSNASKNPSLSHEARTTLEALTQPLTVTQLAGRLKISMKRCSDRLHHLRELGLVSCLNPAAVTTRVYAQRAMVHRLPPDVDWELYGRCCTRHRSALIRHLTDALHPAALRRRVRFHIPGVRMSANNARDTVQFLFKIGVVRQVRERKEHHPRYELSSTGRIFQDLLWRAEERP